MTTLKPYPGYKDSDTGWLERVPAHWGVVSLKRITTSRCDGPFGSGLKSSHYTESGVRVVRLQNIGFGRFDDRSSAFISSDYYATLGDHDVLGGDIIIAGLGDAAHPCGRACVAPNDIEPAMVKADCFRFRIDQEVVAPKFLALQLSATAADASGLLSTGATRQRVNLQNMSGRSVALPPLDEQRAIADFLDAMDARIARFIAARKKMTRLLEEKKQAVINQAVTKGLDQTVPMRDSGVDWLGEIPAHWKYVAIGRYWKVIDCKHVTVPFVSPAEDTFPLASVVQAQSFDLDLSIAKHTTAEWYRFLIEGGRQPQPGDLVFCRNVSVGSAAYVGTNEDFAMGQDVCLLSSPTYDSRFLNYCLAGGPLRRAIDMLLVGSTFRRINVADIRSLKLPLPPGRDEQREIVAQFDRATCRIESAIERSKREIELIQEYRARLTSDVVTGKLDVRGVDLGELPELEEVPEPGDNSEVLGYSETLDVDERPTATEA